MEMTIREMIELDALASVSRLAGRVWREHYTPLIGPEQVEYMLEKFQAADCMQKQIREEGYRYYAGFTEDNPEPVAYAAFCPEPDGNVFLSKLYVERECRGKGIAKKLLAYGLEQLRTGPEAMVWLTVNKGNAASIAAYQKMGFAIAEAVVTDIGGGYVMDDYRMERRLLSRNVR